ncbi:c-type cytochrome [Geomonas oryzisoli]|uniref:C-type cytochrome n=1 Tax=Geomonas oryzisoli TaxID=2847992 RepID=A0ABX8J664_9BACT|nr:c-type cytochrome [Geomonas oryzisoli]QWV93798.1 c-type cytochrome [Geomonas oryzisoli]
MPVRPTTRLSPPPPGGRRPGGGPGTRPGERPLRRATVAWLALAALLGGCTDSSKMAPLPPASARGEQLFKERCAPCHPDGGNVINRKKTLHGGVLADNGITTPSGIVARMRNPGPGMTRFDRGTIPDADARLIAEYILATYR